MGGREAWRVKMEGGGVGVQEGSEERREKRGRGATLDKRDRLGGGEGGGGGEERGWPGWLELRLDIPGVCHLASGSSAEHRSTTSPQDGP